MDHEKHFAFPADCEASAAVLDLMKKLICKQSIRIGSNGAHEIKEHEWFAGFPWDKIRECICILTIAKPPFIPELSGPEDTRYFEDEENESKKLNQKTVKKTKDYSGQGLPFVGYTYLQNLTPVVSLNGAAPTASVSTISTSSSSADKKRIEDLENQIKQLSKATTSDSLKADLETTSKRLESELLIKLQLEEQVAKFNTERIEAQSKIQQLKFEKENDLQERKELVAKVSELSNSLDKEIQSNHGLQDLNESKIKLEKLNLKLKADVESERATALLNIEMAAELGRAKALAELELEQIQRQLHSEQAAAASTKEANQILERKLQDQVQKSSQVEVEKSFLVQRETEFQAKLDSIELLLLDSTTKLDATNSLLLSVEREKALVSAELREASITLAELQLEKDELSISLSEKAKNGVQGSTEADNLRNELTLLEKKRADELTYNSKQRALIEFEFGEVSKKLASELAITKDLKAKLSATEKKVSDLEQSIQALSSTNQSFLLAATHHTAELNSIQLQLRETRSTLNITYLKSGSLEKANMMMTNEIEELKLKISKQISVNGDQEVKIKELETLLEMETKNRNLSEMNFKTSQAAKDALQLDLTRSLARINALKEEQTKYFQDLQAFENREMVLKAEISDLNAKNEQNHLIYDDDCKNFNSERESFNLRLAKIASQLEDSETLCKSLTRQLDKIQEFEGKQILKDSDSNSPSANKRFSKSASLEHFKSDSSSIKSSNTFASSLKPDSGSTKGLGSMVKGLKLKTFFKSSSSRDELTTTKHHSKIPEHYVSNDEVVFDSNSPRKLSASDSNSLMSAGKINKHISQVSVNSSHVDFRLLEYDFAEGLKGWIKVPKQGGKIKKGWKRVYALVKDYKIYIYEKEVSTDDANSKYIEVFDLRYICF